MIRIVLLLAATTTTAISASPHSPPVLERQWRLRLDNPIAALADSKTRFGTVAADVLAGSGAALVAYSIATPLETVKTVNQMKLIGNLGNHNLYTSTPEEREQIENYSFCTTQF